MTAAATGSGGALEKKLDWLPYFVGAMTLFVLVAFLLYPIGKSVLSSFVKSGDSLDLANFTLLNFEKFFSSPSYQRAFFHSLVVALAATVFATLLALPAAFAISRISMPFRNVLLSLSVIPLISPPFIGAYSWVILLGKSGIVTHYIQSWFGVELPSIYGAFGIILALSLSYFPYVLLIVQGALAASDPYIEECAFVMGANRWRVLRTITFPLVLPSIAAGSIIVFIKALGNFGVPAILGGEYYVLPTMIYFQVHGYFNLNGASAIAMVNVILTLGAILVLTRVNKGRGHVTVTGGTRRSAQMTGLGAMIFANAYCWGLLFVALLPHLMVLYSSFAEKWAGTLFPTQWGIANYLRVISDVQAPFINSMVLAGVATALCVVFGTLAAYTSVRRRFVGKWALDLTIMLPFVLPGIVTGVAYITTFNSGLIVLSGTSAILVLAYFVRRIAYIFRTVTAAVGQVDNKLEEASAICGATWGWTFRKITVPLVSPGIIAGGILVFATLISEMSVTILLYSAKWKTMSIAIYEYIIADELLDASAIGSIAIVATLLLVFLSSKIIGKSMAEMFR
ncbi:ABC transporter permease [Shumkonia mesophila]|uniref:ABC transporter permease n=1 Tax=Shumkonia mesophila TaxID=2838854 RepID=UPI0029351911|nr:iron ABC transporter permease [Shumkonia mesophila]